MYSRFDNIEIAGMATTLPAKEINNLEFAEQFGEQVVKKQIKVTGITTRRVAEENQTALDLMVCSAKRLMHKLEWSGEQVDILVFASGYNSCAIPATSYLAQNYLNIKSDCVLYDINLACTGTVDGLYTLMALMQAYPEGARGLLLVGETPTAGEAKNDKTTSMLSSDCGVAIALEKKTAAPVYMSQHTDGSRYEVLVRRDLNDHIHMDGMEVFQFAITDVVKEIENCFEKYAIDKEQIDYFVIHQAQKFIVDKVAFFAHLPKEKVLNSYQWYGNTGGASDICTLCANTDIIKQQESIKVFMTGFGAGLSWAMVVCDIKTAGILPVEYSNEHFEI